MISKPDSIQIELSDPPRDPISAIRFAPKSHRLLVASWDRHVYLHEIQGHSASLIRKFEHRAPVLDVCWGDSEDEAYSVGLDYDVRRIDLTSGEQTLLSTHEAPANAVVYSREQKLLLSSSWDSTIHIHHIGNPSLQTATTVRLPCKPFSLSLSTTKLVVAMAARKVQIYDLKSLATMSEQNGAATLGDSQNLLEVEPFQTRESSLKFMTRAVACMPNDLGYASSSIEGRIAVEWFDPSSESQSRKYAFKWHRQSTAEGIDLVYPVNALAFHPVHGTFASGGGDGFVAVWDALAKRRIRLYQKYPSSVAALDFSTDGKYLAVGVCPALEDGKDQETAWEGEIRVFVRELAEGELKTKAAK